MVLVYYIYIHIYIYSLFSQDLMVARSSVRVSEEKNYVSNSKHAFLRFDTFVLI